MEKKEVKVGVKVSKHVKPRWVRYKDMGGPMFRGSKEHVYAPPKPWGVWTQIMGVVARCEGKHDTVVMYDETGVTFGFLQWTFKSGRLQKLLQFLKSIPSTEEPDRSVFDVHCKDGDRQIFEDYSFRIEGGYFVHNGTRLDPSNRAQRGRIVDVCMGRRESSITAKERRNWALRLCNLFAVLGQQAEVQAAIIVFAKIEFKRAMVYKRPPLRGAGGSIRSLLPDSVWGSPIPAIFWNLYQNAPAGSFRLFENAWKEALKKGYAFLVEGEGYDLTDEAHLDAVLDLIWRRLNKTAYADWGFKSKQYVASGGKNPPRIRRIRPAIREFYAVNLPYYK